MKDPREDLILRAVENLHTDLRLNTQEQRQIRDRVTTVEANTQATNKSLEKIGSKLEHPEKIFEGTTFLKCPEHSVKIENLERAYWRMNLYAVTIIGIFIAFFGGLYQFSKDALDAAVKLQAIAPKIASEARKSK